MKNFRQKIKNLFSLKEISHSDNLYKVYWCVFIIAYFLRLVFIYQTGQLLSRELIDPGSTKPGEVAGWLVAVGASHAVAQYPGVVIEHKRTPLNKLMFMFFDIILSTFFVAVGSYLTAGTISEIPNSDLSDPVQIIALISLVFLIILSFVFSCIFHNSVVALNSVKNQRYNK